MTVEAIFPFGETNEITRYIKTKHQIKSKEDLVK